VRSEVQRSSDLIRRATHDGTPLNRTLVLSADRAEIGRRSALDAVPVYNKIKKYGLSR